MPLKPTKTIVETEQIDGRADKYTQVEIQKQIGTIDKYVLYVHQNGQTVVRISNLTKEQIYFVGVTEGYVLISGNQSINKLKHMFTSDKIHSLVKMSPFHVTIVASIIQTHAEEILKDEKKFLEDNANNIISPETIIEVCKDAFEKFK